MRGEGRKIDTTRHTSLHPHGLTTGYLQNHTSVCAYVNLTKGVTTFLPIVHQDHVCTLSPISPLPYLSSSLLYLPQPHTHINFFPLKWQTKKFTLYNQSTTGLIYTLAVLFTITAAMTLSTIGLLIYPFCFHFLPSFFFLLFSFSFPFPFRP